MIQTLKETGNGYQIPCKYDGAVYDIAIGVDCVCKGVGDEFEINRGDTLTITFNAGSQAIIGGNFFHLVESEQITLSANSTIYLTARIDDTQPNGSKGSFAQCTASNMMKENLNGDGQVRDLLLWIITTNSTGIEKVQDMRVIRGQGSQIQEGYAIFVGTTSEEEAETFTIPTLSFTYDEE